MVEHLSEAILHGLVAALVVEALIRLWRTDEPGFKIRMRGLAVAAPVLFVPLFEWSAPWRHEPWFQDGWALFAGVRWSALRWLGIGLDTWWLAAFGGVGLVLFLRDLVPTLRERGARWHLHTASETPSPGVAERIAHWAARLGTDAPKLHLLDVAAPVLLCRGGPRPSVVISRRTLELLDARELDAALAHELGHLRHHDVPLGWLLMAARTVQAFNPALHVVTRAVARDAERRADDVAALATGDRLSVASGLLKLFKASRGAGAGESLWWPLVAQAREDAIEERCRRQLDPMAASVRWQRVRLAGTLLGLESILFFVT